MESLYTKYRPKTFEEVVGQQHVVVTLERAVLEGRVSHAYLFCGPRGTGKTTMARILAKALLCERGPGHLPDGACDDCQLVAAGAHPDVVEIDAASNTGVENVRDVIIGRVNYAPARGDYKVYIVDEVHMLTTAAFNALLKTLEEPPANVVFVLCTTDPQKIPATILSRVQRFDFHAISPADISDHLSNVCQAEGIAIEPEALELVVRQAHGGMRDALTSLEQLATMTGRNVTLAATRDLFGETSESTLAAVTKALAQRDVASLFEQVAGLVDAGRDLLQFVRELAAHVRDVYVVSALGTTEGVVQATGEEAQALRAEADLFGPADRVARVLTVLGDAASQMRTAPNQQLVLEIAFTRLARPESDLTLESLAERLAVLESRLSQGVAVAVAVPQAASVPDAARPVPGSVRPAATPAPQQSAVGLVAGPGNTFAATPAGGLGASRPVAAETGPAAGAASPRRTGASTGQGRRVGSALSGQSAGPASPSSNLSTPSPAASRQDSPRAEHAPTEGAAPRPATEGRQGSGSAIPAAAAPKAPAPSPAPAQAAPSPQPVDPGALQRGWARVVDALVASSPSRGALLRTSTAVSDDGSTLGVSLPKGSTFALKMLGRTDVRELVNAQVANVFGVREVRFFESGDASGAQQPMPARQGEAASVPSVSWRAPVRQAGPVSAPAQATPPQPSFAPAQQAQTWQDQSQYGASAQTPAYATGSAPAPDGSAPSDDPWDYLPAEADLPGQAAQAQPSRSAQPQVTQAPPRSSGMPSTAPAPVPSRPAPSQPQTVAQPAAKPKPKAKAARRSKNGWVMPEDLAAVTALLEETFGPGISYTIEPAPTTDGTAADDTPN